MKLLRNLLVVLCCTVMVSSCAHFSKKHNKDSKCTTKTCTPKDKKEKKDSKDSKKKENDTPAKK
ncbi:MAG: hypothetical protein R3Y69_05965 [Rikenellaceae bacterium]